MTNRSAVASVDVDSRTPGGLSPDSMLDAFLRKVRARDARIGVMGLGYVGLPLVRLFAGRGFPVTGFDVDESKIARLNKGESYIQSVPSGTIRLLQREKKMKATTDFAKLAAMDAIIICVPTPLAQDGSPDLSYIRATGRSIGEHLRRGQLVILESTSHPGTTREVLKPELERKGLRCGKDFLLAFSPEREDPGNKKFTNATIPKIVGGMDVAARRAAAALYSRAFHER